MIERPALPPTTWAPHRTGLVVFDLLEHYRPGIEAAGVHLTAPPLMAACREHGVPVFYARADHRRDGLDYALCVADTDNKHVPWSPEHPVTWKPPHGAGDPGFQVISEIAPQPGDYDIPKHRWSAFHGTHLELSLRSRGIDTVLLIGGSTHVGVASTAYAARDMDFQVVVVSDCLTGLEEQRLFFAEKVFPRMVNVRTSAQVIEGLGA